MAEKKLTKISESVTNDCAIMSCVAMHSRIKIVFIDEHNTDAGDAGYEVPK